MKPLRWGNCYRTSEGWIGLCAGTCSLCQLLKNSISGLISKHWSNQPKHLTFRTVNESTFNISWTHFLWSAKSRGQWISTHSSPTLKLKMSQNHCGNYMVCQLGWEFVTGPGVVQADLNGSLQRLPILSLANAVIICNFQAIPNTWHPSF